MSDESNGSRDNNNRRNQEPQFNWRGFLLFMVAAALIMSALLLNSYQGAGKTLTFPEFIEMVQQDKVLGTPELPLKLVSSDTTRRESIEGYFFPSTQAVEKVKETMLRSKVAPLKQTINEAGGTSFSVQVNLDLQKEEVQKLLAEKKLSITSAHSDSTLASALITFLPVILVLGLLYFMVRQQIKSAGRGALNFGKSRARLLALDRNKVTFKDVAGVEEAKDEVQEIVEFLKDPKEVPEAGRQDPQGRADGRLSRHGQDPAGQGHRGRGRCAFLQHQRL